jgi:hypothetical protein
MMSQVRKEGTPCIDSSGRVSWLSRSVSRTAPACPSTSPREEKQLLMEETKEPESAYHAMRTAQRREPGLPWPLPPREDYTSFKVSISGHAITPLQPWTGHSGLSPHLHSSVSRPLGALCLLPGHHLLVLVVTRVSSRSEANGSLLTL